MGAMSSATVEEIKKVNEFKKKKPASSTWQRKSKPKFDSASNSLKTCKFCGRQHKMQKSLCPAWGKTCDACNGKNHFKNTERCPKMKRSVHGVQDNYSDSDSSYASINSVVTTGVCV